MRTVIGGLVIAGALTGSFGNAGTAVAAPREQRGQSAPAPAPTPSPNPTPQTPTPPMPPVLPEEVATPRQLVNIKVDLAVVEEGAGEPMRRKEVSLIVADRRSGSVRAGGFPVADKPASSDPQIESFVPGVRLQSPPSESTSFPGWSVTGESGRS